MVLLGGVQWIILKCKLAIENHQRLAEEAKIKSELAKNEENTKSPAPEPIIQIVKEEVFKRRIHIDEKVVLGLGSGGTVVFEGTLNGRLVAVKRMLLQHNQIAEQEIKYLQKVDLHPNVITYFDKEEDRDFLYLAIEKCEGNLENLVELMKATKATEFEEWKNLPLASMYADKPEDLEKPTSIVSIML